MAGNPTCSKDHEEVVGGVGKEEVVGGLKFLSQVSEEVYIGKATGNYWDQGVRYLYKGSEEGVVVLNRTSQEVGCDRCLKYGLASWRFRT